MSNIRGGGAGAATSRPADATAKQRRSEAPLPQRKQRTSVAFPHFVVLAQTLALSTRSKEERQQRFKQTAAGRRASASPSWGHDQFIQRSHPTPACRFLSREGWERFECLMGLLQIASGGVCSGENRLLQMGESSIGGERRNVRRVRARALLNPHQSAGRRRAPVMRGTINTSPSSPEPCSSLSAREQTLKQSPVPLADSLRLLKSRIPSLINSASATTVMLFPPDLQFMQLCTLLKSQP